MKNAQASRFLAYVIASIVLLIIASINIRTSEIRWASIYPFFVLVTLGYQYSVFRKQYVIEKPTLYINVIQWLYLLTLVFSLFLSMMVVIDLIN